MHTKRLSLLQKPNLILTALILYYIKMNPLLIQHYLLPPTNTNTTQVHKTDEFKLETGHET